MDDSTKNKTKMRRRGLRALSIRLIVTVVTVLLIGGAVIGVGAVNERNLRTVMTRELETRLVLEARNLALLSSGALLAEFPELTLHPVLREMARERPDLAMLYIVDHEGVIQGHSEAARLGTRYEPNRDLAPMASGVWLEEAELLIGNADVVVVHTPIRHPSGKVIGTAIVGLDRGHIEALIQQARRTQGVLLLIIIGAAVLLTPVLMSLLLRPIGLLRESLERIGRGDLDTRLELSSRTEFGALSRSINDMASRLKSAQGDLVEKERLGHEMQLAREIQRSLLPGEATTVPNFTISGAQRAADEVGGDYYDVFHLNDGRLGVVIADVAGKGLAGCMVTSMIAVLLRTLCPRRSSPSDLLVTLHEALSDSLQPGMFVTIFYGMLDPRSGQLTYASAGHNPLIHYQAHTRQVHWQRTRGIPLGLMPGEVVRESLDDHTLDLDSGDMLVQYTDGFHEAVNGQGEEFGFDRMEQIVSDCAPEGGDWVLSLLQESVEMWEGRRIASDDKTIVVVECTGATVRALDEPVLQPTGARPELLDSLWRRRKQQKHYFTAPAQIEDLDRIGVWLRRCPFIEDLSQDDVTRLEHGLYELVTNIAEHGCDLDPEKFIDVWWIPEGGNGMNGADDDSQDVGASTVTHVNRGYFLVRDHGRPPEADKWSVSELESDRVRQQGRGLGLRIIYQTFDEIEFHADTQMGNVTLMKFKVPQPQES